MSKRQDLTRKFDRYTKVSLPLLRLLGAWGYGRVILIICAGLITFVLQLGASAILITSLIGRLPFVKQLEQSSMFEAVSALDPLVTVLLALVMFVVATLLDYLAQVTGVWAGRDFSRAQIHRYLSETVARVTAVPSNDFSGTRFGNRAPSIPDTKFLMQSQRALDICTRILLVSSPKIFNGFLCLVLLLTLNPAAMLALGPLIALQMIITYRQSILGMRSRILLEDLMPEVISERRGLLRKFKTASTDERDLYSELERVIHSPNEKSLAHSFSYQFKILYESNLTTRMISILTLLTVILVYRLTLGEEWLGADKTGWVGLASFIIVLRFASTNIETALRSGVAVNRMFKHLEIFVRADLEQKEVFQPERAEDGALSKTYAVPTLLGVFEPLQMQDDPGANLKIRSDTLELTQGSRVILYKTTKPSKAVVDLSRSVLQFAPSQEHNFSTQSSHIHWRLAPVAHEGRSLSDLLGHQSTVLNHATIVNMLRAMGIAAPEETAVAQVMLGEYTAEKQAALTGFSIFLLDLAAALKSNDLLLFLELSMLDQIERDFGVQAQQTLLGMLSNHIVVFYHYRSKEDALAKSLGAVALYEINGRLAGWGAADNFIPFEDIAKLTTESQNTANVDTEIDLIEASITI